MYRQIPLVIVVLLSHTSLAQIKDFWEIALEGESLRFSTNLADYYENTRNAPCWAKCFQTDDTPSLYHLKPAYNDIFAAGHEAMRLALMYSVNGTAYLFDSTLSQYHHYHKALKFEERGANIFQFQKDLGIIVSAMMGHNYEVNPAYVVQFDNEKAWSCERYGCNDRCRNIEVMHYMDCVESDVEAYQEGKIEPACRLADDLMTNPEWSNCTSYLENEMAIAFVNSDFDHNVQRVQHNHGSHHNDHYSACQSHFKTRLVIGTHAVDEHEMDDFQSPDAYYTYIRDNAYTMEAASILAGCVRASCCDPDDDFHDTDFVNGTCYQVTEDYSVPKKEYYVEHEGKGSEVTWGL